MQILQNLKNGFRWSRLWWTIGYYALQVFLDNNSADQPLWIVMLADLFLIPLYYFFLTRKNIDNDSDNNDDDGDEEYTDEYLKQESDKVLERGIVRIN